MSEGSGSVMDSSGTRLADAQREHMGLVRGSLTPVMHDQAATVPRSAKATSNSTGVRRPSAR